MNIVVTGGQGFLGSAIVDYYENKGYNVESYDNNRTSTLKEQQKYINQDLTIYSSYLDESIKKSDLVFHFASSVGVKDIDSGPEAFWNSHLINNNVISLCKKYNKKIIFTSTSEVYGDIDRLLSETDDFRLKQLNRSSYASEKINAEFMIKNSDIPYIILRPFNITGKGQLPNYGMVLPNFIDKALNNEDILIYDNGLQVRSFCDIRDFIEAVSSLVKANIENEVFNIGNYNIINIKDLANLVIDLTNSKSKIKYIESKNSFTKEHFEIKYRAPNLEKLMKYYKPKYSLEDIVRSMV